MDEDIEKSIRNIARGASILAAGALLSKMIMYFYRVLIARQLGTAEYGLITLGLSVFWITFSISQIGVSAGVKRKISSYMGDEKKGESHITSVLWSSLSITIPASIVAAFILFFGAEFISAQIFSKPELAQIIRILAIALPFQMLYGNFDNAIEAFREMKYIVYVDKIFRSLLTLGLTAILLFAGYGLMGAVVAQLVAIIMSSMLIFYFFQYKVFPFLSKKTSDVGLERKKLIKYSWPLFLSGIIGLVMSWSDTIFIGYFQASEAVGVYNAAYPTSQLLTIIAGGLSTTLFPTVSEYYGRGEKHKSLDLASAVLKWNFATIFPGAVVMALFAQPILLLLFGESYTGGAAALGILGGSYLFRAMTDHVGIFMKSEDATKLPFYNSIIIAILNIILNIFLIPIYSATGAALATTAATVIGSFLGVIELRYLLGIKGVYRLKDYAAPFIATIISGSMVYGITQIIFETTPIIAVIPAGIFFGILYGIFYLLLGGLDDRDILLVHEIEDRTNISLDWVEKWIRKIAR